jgi:hypothetical protein
LTWLLFSLFIFFFSFYFIVFLLCYTDYTNLFSFEVASSAFFGCLGNVRRIQPAIFGLYSSLPSRQGAELGSSGKLPVAKPKAMTAHTIGGATELAGWSLYYSAPFRGPKFPIAS